VTYDHTDADVPMMQPLRVGWVLECRLPEAPAEPVTGAVGYDENGDHYAVSYPPQGMRCS
jgi:hypothetical protein